MNENRIEIDIKDWFKNDLNQNLFTAPDSSPSNKVLFLLGGPKEQFFYVAVILFVHNLRRTFHLLQKL